MSTREYRADVDGLRAVAVLAVLFFHLDLATWEGGFVGVDVFLVISGFLITRIIQQHIDESRFSFSGFYLRRVRRILPALAVTLAVSLVAAYFVLTPARLEEAARSAVFAIGSLANHLFLAEAGYFDTESDLKVFLHTWSLSVEEQFYLIWPALLVGFNRFRRSAVLPLIAVVSVVSLALSQYLASNYPSAAFFIMPSRIFEFGIGAMLAYVVYSPPRWLADASFAAGLALVALAIFTFDELATTFPGVMALVPTVGAGLVIFGGQKSRLRPLLANQAMVWIGLISYSLYLVHWPVYVLWKFQSDGVMTAQDRIGVIALSYVLACLSYWFVETPFRIQAPAFGQRRQTRVALAGVVVVGGLAGGVWALDGLSARLDTTLEELVTATEAATESRVGDEEVGNCAIEELDSAAEYQDCIAGFEGRVLIVGDSHGRDVLRALSIAYGGENFSMLRQGGCNAYDYVRDGRVCFRHLDDYFAEYATVERFDAIVLASHWLGDPEEVASEIINVRSLLPDDMPVIVFGRTIAYSKIPLDLAIGHGSVEGLEQVLFNNIKQESVTEGAALRDALVDNGSVGFVDKQPYLCSSSSCEAVRDGVLLYADRTHWNLPGAAHFAEALAIDYASLEALIEVGR